MPFSSAATTLAGSGVPTKSLFGLNVIIPVVGSTTYLPTSTPLLSAGISVTSAPVGSTNLIVSFLIGATGFPSLNKVVASWVCSLPWISFVLAGVAVGLTGVIFGVYVVFTVVPLVSAAWIVTGGTDPTYVLSVGV